MTEFWKFDTAADGTGATTTHFFGDDYPQHELKFFAFPASWNIRMQRQMGAFLYDTNRYGRSLKDVEEFIEKGAEIPGWAGWVRAVPDQKSRFPRGWQKKYSSGLNSWASSAPAFWTITRGQSQT